MPTLNFLLPILSELTSSQNNETVITPVAVPQLSQIPPDELILPPVLVPRLQMATNKPSTTEDPTPKLNRREIKLEPLSLELF